MNLSQTASLLELPYRRYVTHETNPETISAPLSLLTPNRIDLSFKLLYLAHRDTGTDLYLRLYKEHIRAFTLGSFIEPFTPEKTSFQSYVMQFDQIYNSIATGGFDATKSLIPLASDGSIINGAHRTASAIHARRQICGIRLSAPPRSYNWRFFRDRGVREASLEVAAQHFMEHAKDVYIALLWPRSSRDHRVIARNFENVIYDKRGITLTQRGAHNLVSICYDGEPWLGAAESDYPGAISKVQGILRRGRPLRVIAFQNPDRQAVRIIKDRIRSQFAYGKHCVHVTDSQSEALILGSLLFNENGIHFLNYGYPNRFGSLMEKWRALESFVRNNQLNHDDFVVDSGMLLELYGIRKSNDIDIIVSSKISALQESVDDTGVHLHNDELKYHKLNCDEIVYNHEYNFSFRGVKFVSFKQVYAFKRSRWDKKDRRDLWLMHRCRLNVKFGMRYIGALRSICYRCKARYFDPVASALRKRLKGVLSK